jgi:hypothetical protein
MPAGRGRAQRRRAAFEGLEDRRLLAAVPYGAAPDDTAEYLLGDVLVTTVLMESASHYDPVTNPTGEDWTAARKELVQQKVMEGMRWWEDTLQAQYPNAPNPLQFHYDWTYVDTPAATASEPITQSSNAFQTWIYDFLKPAGYAQNQYQASGFSADIRAFNDAQRRAYQTNWAFTIFVVNDEHDVDGMFAPGGFSKAFSFPGGQFVVAPAGRPASTFAHETGHIFWARDEYAGACSYSDYRGYYNTQNANCATNPTPGFVQADSLMANGAWLDNAYARHTSSASSLQMLGWRDSDGDGLMDVLDVPFTLEGVGSFDPQTGEYRFLGESAVQTLPNRNTSGLQNDITINEISRAEYSLDGGRSWQTAAEFHTYAAILDLHIPLPNPLPATIHIRTIDDRSRASSPIFQGDFLRRSAAWQPGISGFVWNDADSDGLFDGNEVGLSGWKVQLTDDAGQPLPAAERLEPDHYAAETRLNAVNSQVALAVVGGDTNGTVAAGDSDQTSTGSKVFATFTLGNVWSTDWTPDTRQLRMNFAAPVSQVALDATGSGATSYGRLEAYDAQGNLLARYTTGLLEPGHSETMLLGRSKPEIAYAIARAHTGPTVKLDNLRFGPDSSAVTDSQGYYALPSLPAGTYRVRAVGPAGSQVVTASQLVTPGEGEAVGQVNFASQSAVVSWQNSDAPLDVMPDSVLSAQDALAVINYINTHPSDPRVYPAADVPPPYCDVNGDGLVTAVDVLLVINAINTKATAATSADSASSSSPAAVSAAGESCLAEPARRLSGPADRGVAAPAVPNPSADDLVDDFFRQLATQEDDFLSRKLRRSAVLPPLPDLLTTTCDDVARG